MDKIYVVHTEDNIISVIDGRTNTVETTIPVGQFPFGIGVNSVTKRIYVGNVGNKNMSVIDGQTNKVIDTISFPDLPEGESFF